MSAQSTGRNGVPILLKGSGLRVCEIRRQISLGSLLTIWQSEKITRKFNHSRKTYVTMLIDPVRMAMHGAVSNCGCYYIRVSSNKLLDFTHDMARSRAFRWGEDGIAGVSDTHGRQHVAFAFWNEKE